MARSPEGNPDSAGIRGGSEHPFPSTRWEWRQVRIRPAAGGQGDRRPKGGRWYHLPRWNCRRPLSLTVKYRGGPECWVEVRSRGAMGRFPGNVALVDVCRELWQDSSPS